MEEPKPEQEVRQRTDRRRRRHQRRRRRRWRRPLPPAVVAALTARRQRRHVRRRHVGLVGAATRLSAGVVVAVVVVVVVVAAVVVVVVVVVVAVVLVVVVGVDVVVVGGGALRIGAVERGLTVGRRHVRFQAEVERARPVAELVVVRRVLRLVRRFAYVRICANRFASSVSTCSESVGRATHAPQPLPPPIHSILGNHGLVVLSGTAIDGLLCTWILHHKASTIKPVLSK